MNVSSQSYIDELFADYQRDPQSVPEEWRHYFHNFKAFPRAQVNGKASPAMTSGGPVADGPTAAAPSAATAINAVQTNASVASPASAGATSVVSTTAAITPPNKASLEIALLQDRVDQMIRGYRVRGHLDAQIDPLGIARPGNRELNPESYGISAEDFKRQVSSRTIEGADVRTVEEIVNQLRSTYCRSIGAQFMHIDDYDVRNWLQSRMEKTQNRMTLDRKTQLRILTKLTDAVIFEEFMRKKYLGAKTFSLEGAETLIPLLDLALEKSGEHGVREIVLGMAHRGRLNVLANIMGKRAQNIFWGFDDPNPENNRGGGDVMYHMGYSNDWTTSTGKNVHISLCFNPSHLEFVNAVAMGRCRAKQDRFGDRHRTQCMNVLIHGDAAFIGEGIVQETLNMSELNGYRIGGTLHVIVNNQVGFTTDVADSRSTTYASDVAKMLQIPIFHVNGEDPEAVAQVVDLAMEFRRQFQRDVVIDMYCYRRLGHNESDEPRFTQPLMYRAIDNRPTIRDSYLKHLLKLQEVTSEEAEQIVDARKAALEREFEATRSQKFASDEQSLAGAWQGFVGGAENLSDDVDTGSPLEQLVTVLDGISRHPSTFTINRKLERLMQSRVEMAQLKRPIDWPTAELLAFGTLALEGHTVRLTGQDCERGTFSQRHGVLIDAENGSKYHSLKHLASHQAPIDIYNSPLSEAGVLGFEYGFSLDTPDGLVMWEAQFGDFWNVAQVIVDQFICSAEAKWRRLSGITMLLPHGFEGAGPEHCSARVERFLTLAAQHNIQVAYPTTAAQYFHLLRRQVVRKWRKPLVVLTPKSLLREPAVMSGIEEFTRGTFSRVLPDPLEAQITNPSKIILCSGKIGIDLLKHREQQPTDEIAIIRLEQLYPFPTTDLRKILGRYPADTPITWVQEEPRNMGPWYFARIKWDEQGFSRDWNLSVVCRPESASPSTGSKKAHVIEHNELLAQAFEVPHRVAPVGNPV